MFFVFFFDKEAKGNSEMARSGSSLVHKRSHRNRTLSAGCPDRSDISGLDDDLPLVGRSVGPAAAAAVTAADDHDDNEDKTTADDSSLTHIRHLIPPGKET